MFKLVPFSKMCKLLREPWTYTGKSWQRFFFLKPPGSGQCVAFAFVPAAGSLRAGGLEVTDSVPESRSAPMALRRHWAFPPFPASESFVLVLSSRSRKGTLLTKGFSESPPDGSRPSFLHSSWLRLGIHRGPRDPRSGGGESWGEEESGQPGYRLHGRRPAPLSAQSLGQCPSRRKGCGQPPR